MAVPLSASSARSTARSSGTVRRPAFCRCTVTANASPGRTGLAGSCKAAVTCRRSVRASHHKNAVNTIASASRNTTNGARLTAAAQNSTASSRPQPTLPAMGRFLRAGARHSVQHVGNHVFHRLPAGAGLLGQTQAVVRGVGKNRGHILGHDKLPP